MSCPPSGGPSVRGMLVKADRLVIVAGLVAVGATSTAGLIIWLLLTSPLTLLRFIPYL